ncbi:MAG: hypothetical protein ACKO7B_06330, partial [Flavobacteriales bacterium]
LLFPYIFTTTCILSLLIVPRLRAWVLGLRTEVLIWMIVLRLPVEFLFHWSALFRQSSWDLTSYGGSVELFFGLTAPLMIWLLRKKSNIARNALLVWNIVGALTLSFLWIKGLLGAPSAIQTRAFDTPNYLLVHFPGSWMVTVIIPIVLFAHLALVTQLLKRKKLDA